MRAFRFGPLSFSLSLTFFFSLSETPKKKKTPTPQLALLAGASFGGSRLRASVRAAQREQALLCAEADSERGVGPGNNNSGGGGGGGGKAGSLSARRRRHATPKVAVDAVFARRLVKILKL